MELRAEMIHPASLEVCGLPQMMRSFRFSVALGWSLPHVPHRPLEMYRSAKAARKDAHVRTLGADSFKLCL